MKRIIRILVALLLCLAMAMPAMAAEVYEFFPAPVALSDLSFFPDDNIYFCESFLSNGSYTLTAVDLKNDEMLVSEPFVLSFGEPDETGFSYAYFDLIFPNLGNFPVPAGFALIDGTGTAFAIIDENGDYYNPFKSCDYIIVSPHDETLVSSEIIDIIHAVLFGSFLICGTLVGLALFRGNRYV